MLRQVSSRNHRAKGGFRAKNAFQVSILVAVCVWLLYQMKYSHDHRKAYEEKFGVDGSQSDISRFARKELHPHADAEDASTRQDVKQGEGIDGEHKQHVAARVDRDGKKKPGAVEDQEHEEHSHEAREKSFRGDDASSEVVHHSQELEHEEQTQEARERSFKADDVSSAVDHVAPLKEEVFDNYTPSAVQERKTNATSFEIEKKKKKKSPSSNATDESDLKLEKGSVIEAVAHINNGTDPRRFQANELENQRELGLRSRNLSKDQTAKAEDPTEEAQRNQTRVADPELVNRTAVHTLQDLNDTAKSSKEAEVVVLHKKQSDQTARSQPAEEKPKTSPVTSDGEALPLNATAEEKRDEHGRTLQSKVGSHKEEAAE